MIRLAFTRTSKSTVINKIIGLFTQNDFCDVQLIADGITYEISKKNGVSASFRNYEFDDKYVMLNILNPTWDNMNKITLFFEQSKQRKPYKSSVWVTKVLNELLDDKIDNENISATKLYDTLKLRGF